MTAVTHDGGTDAREELVVTQSTLSCSLCDHTLIESILLNTVLEQLGVLSLRLKLNLFLIIQLNLGFGLRSSSQMLL